MIFGTPRTTRKSRMDARAWRLCWQGRKEAPNGTIRRI